jgi:Pyruvate/2-oxoacid:ferredoxin oxidoreductase delta subunit/flavodoxin
MRTAIFYFSGTGNSLVVARKISAKLGDTTITNMATIEKQRIELNVKRIGIVFPVYIFGIPLIVQRFIQNLHIDCDIYTFAVATHGGLPCATLTQAEKLFVENGSRLSAGFQVLMVDNAAQIADIIPREKQQKRFAKAERQIDTICRAIGEGKNEIYRGNPMTNWIFSAMYKKAVPDLPGFDKNFVYDEKCNACGICEKLCPMNNVVISERHPVWLHHCEQCMACFHWCPRAAIQYGPKTGARSRYHHPEVEVADMVLR